MNLSCKQDLMGKYFHERSYTDHLLDDYLVKPIPKLLTEILNSPQ